MTPRHRPPRPLRLCAVQQRRQVPQRVPCNEQQREDGENAEQPTALQQLDLISSDGIDIV